MSPLWQAIVQTVVAVVVGGIIGYVTNALAIRMLFRPYKAVYLGRWRIPFTPGIIPAQRERLAESLGDLVNRNLFNRDSLDRYLQEPEFATKISGAINQGLESWYAPSSQGASSEAPGLMEVIGPREELAPLLSALFECFVESPRFSQSTLRLAHDLANFLDSLPLKALLPKDSTIAEIRSGIERVQGGASVPAFLERLGRTICRDFIQSEQAVGEILGIKNTRIFRDALERFYPHGTEVLLAWLREPSMRGELTLRSRNLLRSAMEKLNAAQRFFVGVAGFDRKLDETMPAIIDDALKELSTALRADSLRKTFLDSVEKRLNALLLLAPRDFLAAFALDPQRLERIVGRYLRQSTRQSTLPQRIIDALIQFVEHQGQRTLGQFANDVGGIAINRLADFTAERVIEWVRNPGLTNKLFDHSLGLILSLGKAEAPSISGSELNTDLTLPEQDLGRKQLSIALGNIGIRILRTSLPGLIDRFDIADLVRRRVRELNMKELEAMIMGLSKRELEWINILGAILGAIIGCAQALISLLF